MHYILESFFVGLYSLTIFWITNMLGCGLNMNVIAFITGFLKHFLGWFLQLHFYYCKKKWKCKKHIDNFVVLLVECFLEGVIFVLFYNLLHRQNIMSDARIFFSIGVILHILSENLGIHKQFCESRCYFKKN